MSDLASEIINKGGVPDGYVPIEVAFIRFDQPGFKVIGRLVGKHEQKVKFGTVGKYTVQKENGDKVAFLGSVDLDEKMRSVAVGRDVWIEYTNEETQPESEYSIKKFKVFVKSFKQ